MNIVTASASAGLTASASTTSTQISGTVQIGASATVSLTDVDSAYSIAAVIAASTEIFSCNLTNGVTSASTAFVAGTAQVETATAAGTITTAGTATATVTAAGMTGSPKAVSFSVALDDTATLWAAKARAALAADTDVSALFTVSGSGTSIVLTRKTSLGTKFANDATLNIALANNTSVGITAASTSADTTAGVASTGTLVTDGDGKDFEGNTIPTIATLKALKITCTNGSATYATTDESGEIAAGETRVFINDGGLTGLLDTLAFTATSAITAITITVAGSTT